MSKTELQSIPGVGPQMEKDLIRLGYMTIASLKNANPEEMYLQACAQCGKQLDHCVLYVFRCAVYFASNEYHDTEKLKWWNCKD